MVLSNERKEALAALIATSGQELLGASLQNTDAGKEATFIKVRAHLPLKVDADTREYVRGLLNIGLGTWKNFESRYRNAHPAFNPNVAGYDPNATPSRRKNNLVALSEGMENNSVQIHPKFAKVIANHMKSTVDLLDGYCYGKHVGQEENGRTMKRTDIRHFETGNRIGLNRMQAPTPTKPIKPFNGKKAPRGPRGGVVGAGGAADVGAGPAGNAGADA